MSNRQYILTHHQLWEFGASLFSEGFMRALDINSDFPVYHDSFGTTGRDNAVQKAMDKLKNNG